MCVYASVVCAQHTFTELWERRRPNRGKPDASISSDSRNPLKLFVVKLKIPHLGGP